MTQLGRLLLLSAAFVALGASPAALAGIPTPDDSAPAADKPDADVAGPADVNSQPDDSGPVDDDMDRGGDNLTITNGPVPDTPENRDRYGGPDSQGGADTRPAGN